MKIEKEGALKSEYAKNAQLYCETCGKNMGTIMLMKYANKSAEAVQNIGFLLDTGLHVCPKKHLRTFCSPACIGEAKGLGPDWEI